MKNTKSFLQKVSGIIGIICFLLAVVCAVALYLMVQERGMQDVVSASLLASSFFFAFIGFVFMVISNTDIPSFKIDSGVNSGEMNRDEIQAGEIKKGVEIKK
jgi:hypothetical protein